MMARISILSGLQISTNPRVVKEANTLADAGYEVEVLGALVEPRLRDADRELTHGKAWSYVELVDAASRDWRARFAWLKARARRRFWREAQSRMGVSNAQQVSYVGTEMLRYALDHPADLCIAHNPIGFWAGSELMRRGMRVAADFEDWYSEDVDEAERSSYPLDELRKWEAALLQRGAYATTTSSSLSAALSSSYGCSPPTVIYNSFSLRERESIQFNAFHREESELPSLCWFSQVAGNGRGLETLMDALPGVARPFEIHLRAKFDPAYQLQLLARAPESWRQRIHFHPRVRHSELTPWIAQHDIGLAGDLSLRKSRALTITNKVFHYLLAGVPVLASDTPGHREVAALAEGAAFLFGEGDAMNLAARLNDLLGDRPKLRVAREKAVAAAEQYFCWERSGPTLLRLVTDALNAPAPRAMPTLSPSSI